MGWMCSGACFVVACEAVGAWWLSLNHYPVFESIINVVELGSLICESQALACVIPVIIGLWFMKVFLHVWFSDQLDPNATIYIARTKQKVLGTSSPAWFPWGRPWLSAPVDSNLHIYKTTKWWIAGQARIINKKQVRYPELILKAQMSWLLELELSLTEINVYYTSY